MRWTCIFRKCYSLCSTGAVRRSGIHSPPFQILKTFQTPPCQSAICKVSRPTSEMIGAGPQLAARPTSKVRSNASVHHHITFLDLKRSSPRVYSDQRKSLHVIPDPGNFSQAHLHTRTDSSSSKCPPHQHNKTFLVL